MIKTTLRLLSTVLFLLACTAAPLLSADSGVKPKEIKNLIAQLSDKEYSTREAATRQLIQIGEEARAEVTKAAKSADPEVAERAKRILSAMHRTTALGTAEQHVEGILRADSKMLTNTYSDNVLLMPGHEFLKEKYGLSDPDGRDTGKQLKREKVLAVIDKEIADMPGRTEDRIRNMLDTLTFERVKTKPGEFLMDPPDPVKTEDGKLHFPVQKGDEIIKVSPPQGDFLLLHLRKGDSGWKVIAEYVD